MSDSTSSKQLPLHKQLKGTIDKIPGDFGFITLVEFPGVTVYFKTSSYKGENELVKGDDVKFKIRSYDADDGGKNYTAYDIVRPGELTKNLKDWAYLGHIPGVIKSLREIARYEDWEFKNESDTNTPLPILKSYLMQTYSRLAYEKKIAINKAETLAAFNTGLVNELYELIYAMFESQNDSRNNWKFIGFCIAGEGTLGQNLVRNFKPLPERAHYFESPSDLLYDVREGEPALDCDHMVIQRIDRWPSDFIVSHCPKGFTLKSTDTMQELDRLAYYESLAEAIKKDPATHRNYTSRLKYAVALAIKRTSWNFKTAIPMYYPKIKRLQLLLPLCLVRDDEVDVALAVEKTDVGSYQGHTILKLDWAYNNARLICCPESDWLTPKKINEEVTGEDF